jgi:hypothetical protein
LAGRWKDAYTRESRFARSGELDLVRRQGDILGGFRDSFDHPRGARWVFRDWNLPGLRTAVHVAGTLNDDSDVDDGWNACLVLPWAGMGWIAGDRALPHRPGDRWRMNLFRFERLDHNGRRVEPGAGWAWRPHGLYDSHRPESFLEVEFSDAPVL